MSFLSAAEITAMQAAADLALPVTGAIYRATLASDSMGGFYLAIASGVDASVWTTDASDSLAWTITDSDALVWTAIGVEAGG